MGCFCFGSSKHRRRPKGAPISPSHQIREGDSGCTTLLELAKKAGTELPTELTAPAGVEERLPEEQLEVGWKKKKVTFDLNVETYELPAEEVFGNSPRREEIDEAAEEDEREKEGTLHSDSPTPGAVRASSYPLGHRYHSCASSDDECEETDNEGISDDDDDNEGNDENSGGRNELLGQQNVIQQESSESLFSLSIDSRRNVCAADAEEKEVSSPMPVAGSEGKEWSPGSLNQNTRLRGQQGVHSVLNPVEDLFQWEKSIKARATSPSKNQEKENLKFDQDFAFSTPFSPEPAPKPPEKQTSSNLTPKEIAVETSLSSWLSLSESTPKSKASSQSVRNSPTARVKTPRSAEDRPILGVLTVEDLRQLSASNSPVRSRGRSPDDTPIIGTVGSYWSHTGQATDSDSRSSCRGMKSPKCNKEDQRTSPRCISFEARLETTL